MLIGFHYLGDYGLQSNYVAVNKNKDIHVMIAHCAIQALGVLLATNRWEFAAGEFFAHMALDYFKCRGVIGINLDQLGHIVCKFIWWGLL